MSLKELKINLGKNSILVEVLIFRLIQHYTKLIELHLYLIHLILQIDTINLL